MPDRSLFCRYCCVLLNVAVAVSCASSYRRVDAIQARIKSALRNVLPPPRIGRALLLMYLFCLFLQNRKGHLPNQSCEERWKHVRNKVILFSVECCMFFSVATKCILKYRLDSQPFWESGFLSSSQKQQGTLEGWKSSAAQI